VQQKYHLKTHVNGNQGTESTCWGEAMPARN